MALKFLEHQEYDDFVVIVCDNFIDPALSCEKHCINSSVKHIKYIRPPKPVGMVENWNYALQFATGDYICYFTDKMFLLPGTLDYVDRVLQDNQSDIVNWVDNKFTAKQFPDYFGEGTYRIETPNLEKGLPYQSFGPLAELRKKAQAAVSRNEQDSSHYARGKICFGAFSSDLISRIKKETGQLFHVCSPDYSSMILGLSFAHSALEINRSGIVHINTDLSNGGQTSIKDELALAYITSLNIYQECFQSMLVPGLYACSHNMVAHDYLSLKEKYNLDFELNRVNWLAYINEDLDVPGRRWSNVEVEQQQKNLYNQFVEKNLSEAERNQLNILLRSRAVKRKSNRKSLLKETLKPFIPETLLNLRRKLIYRGSITQVKALTDILVQKV